MDSERDLHLRSNGFLYSEIYNELPVVDSDVGTALRSSETIVSIIEDVTTAEVSGFRSEMAERIVRLKQ